MIDLMKFVTDKDIENAKQRVRLIHNRSISFNNDRRLSIKEKRQNYDLYNGIVDPNDVVTGCIDYGVDIALPAKVRHLDIVRSKVNVLVGEQIKRPFRCTVQGISNNITSEKYEARKQSIIEGLMLDLQATAFKKGLAEEPPEQQPPSLEALSNSKYEDKREALAAKIRKIERQRLGIEDLTLEGWQHAVIVAEEFYHIGEKKGKPNVRLVNPLHLEYEISSGINDIKYAEWVSEHRIVMPYTVIEEFLDELEEQDAKRIEKYNNYFYGRVTGENQIIADRAPVFSDGLENYIYEDGISVIHNEWRQMITIKVWTYIDADGNEVKELVPANFKIPKELRETSTIKKYNKVIAWEGTLIANDIVVRVRPIPDQMAGIDDFLNDCELNYIGRVYSNLNSMSTSVVQVLKPIQLLINGLNYKLELELMKSDTGKKLLMDVTQLPKIGDTALTLKEWLAYMNNSNIIFINPSAENNEGQMSGFNQFKEIDLALSQSIQQFINVIQFLMSTASSASGISPQRESTVGSDELVGNVNRALTQSAHITEILFKNHEEIVRQLDEKLIRKAKALYSEEMLIQYINDDGENAILKYDPTILNDGNYAVYVTTSSREIEVLGKATEDIERALQSGLITMAEAARLRKSDSLAEIIMMFESNERKRKMQEEAAKQQEQETMKEIEALKLQAKQEEAVIRREELSVMKENNIRDNETRLKIAEMNKEEKVKNNFELPNNTNNIATKDTFQERLKLDAEIKKTLAEAEAIKRGTKEKKNE